MVIFWVMYQFAGVGDAVQLKEDFEGYKKGDLGVIDEIALTSDGLVIRVKFYPIPGSIEDVPLDHFRSLF